MPIFVSQKTHQTNQEGFTAIIVALIIMSLLVLISIGFLRVVNQEQRASIDRQLSSQAFYAAESGVNDTAQIIAQYIADGSYPPPKEECDVSDSGDYKHPNNGDLDDEVAYTCILVEPYPETLQYDNVGTEHDKAIFINAGDENGPTNDPIGTLNLSWNAAELPEVPEIPTSSGIGFPDEDNFSQTAPVLRVALTPLSSAGSINRQDLVDNTYTVFLRPSSGGGGSTNSTTYIGGPTERSNQGRVIVTQCDLSNEPLFCSMDIGDLTDSNYLMRVRSFYSESSVLISPAASNPDLRFYGQQAVIDATGRASDVLRRIQVRVPVRATYNLPSFALESAGGGICKPYSVYPGSGSNTGNTLCDL